MSTANFNLDDLANDALKADVEVDVRGPQTPRTYPDEPAVRLAAAQKSVRAHRVDPSVWATYDEGYYQSHCGDLTSESEFDILHSIAALIRCQPHYSMPMFGFDRKTAEGVALDVKSNTKLRVPIAQLRSDVAARIAELGVKNYLLWEYLAEEHTAVEDRGFYALAFEDRIKKFKTGAGDAA
jgi:hypothetical protein